MDTAMSAVVGRDLFMEEERAFRMNAGGMPWWAYLGQTLVENRNRCIVTGPPR